jgi:hypothetical protein
MMRSHRSSMTWLIARIVLVALSISCACDVAAVPQSTNHHIQLAPLLFEDGKVPPHLLPGSYSTLKSGWVYNNSNPYKLPRAPGEVGANQKERANTPSTDFMSWVRPARDWSISSMPAPSRQPGFKVQSSCDSPCAGYSCSGDQLCCSPTSGSYCSSSSCAYNQPQNLKCCSATYRGSWWNVSSAYGSCS